MKLRVYVSDEKPLWVKMLEHGAALWIVAPYIREWQEEQLRKKIKSG